jgi:hypothetical protein
MPGREQRPTPTHTRLPFEVLQHFAEVAKSQVHSASGGPFGHRFGSALLGLTLSRDPLGALHVQLLRRRRITQSRQRGLRTLNLT